VIFVRRFNPAPRRLYASGFNAILARTRRNPRSALDPRIKSANFLNSILAKREAEAAGAEEAILLSMDGWLTEGSISNLFFYRNGTLYTPSSQAGILEGITRRVVLELADQAGIRTVEGRFRPGELLRAEEAFLTNTSWEIAPLTAIGKKKIGTGRPGGITRRLAGLFRQRVREETKTRTG
jgi:branched-chain amino acid aminotransferase